MLGYYAQQEVFLSTFGGEYNHYYEMWVQFTSPH
jgi:hypothetical protein